jgi:hypothetical protein
MAGDDVTYQPLGKFRFTKYWRGKWFVLSPATDQR